MRKIASVLMILTVFLTAACKKDKGDEIQGASLSFKVNGTLKQASGDTKVSGMYIASEKTLQVIGNLDNNQGISIMISNFHGAGDYNVASDDVNVIYSTNVNGGITDTHFGDTGTIKITTSTSGLVKGTFDFVAHHPVTDVVTHTVTEGKFEAKVTLM